MILDPDPHRCLCCDRRLRSTMLFVCQPCIELGVAIGIELHSHGIPSDEDCIKIRQKIKEVSRA